MTTVHGLVVYRDHDPCKGCSHSLSFLGRAEPLCLKCRQAVRNKSFRYHSIYKQHISKRWTEFRRAASLFPLGENKGLGLYVFKNTVVGKI